MDEVHVYEKYPHFYTVKCPCFIIMLCEEGECANLLQVNCHILIILTSFAFEKKFAECK